MAFFDWVSRRVFNAVHRNNLVYNTCWEDPRLDREALQFGPTDDVLVITSAGCNALDYVLCEPNHVYAVDMNPRQNALLELKIAGIKRLTFDQYFKMFGEGRVPNVKTIYANKLRPLLSPWSQDYWDKKIKWFGNKRHSFYYRGTSGAFARMMKVYTDKVIKVRPHILAILDSETLEEQQKIYRRHLHHKFWNGLIKFTMNRDTTLSLLGVPRAQRRQVESHYEGGVAKYVQDCVEAVFYHLPLSDNYFWRVYMNGCYTRGCCPEYLKKENFEKLRDGLIDRVSVHTDSVQGFLEKHDGTISRFVLLDHMDWLCDHFFPLLEAEWQAIINRARPGARLIWRSGGLSTEFLHQVRVLHRGKVVPIPQLLTYEHELANKLHPRDRVHTYASFYIAQLSA